MWVYRTTGLCCIMGLFVKQRVNACLEVGYLSLHLRQLSLCLCLSLLIFSFKLLLPGHPSAIFALLRLSRGIQSAEKLLYEMSRIYFGPRPGK